jgi:predicted ATPase/DNA-binding SARP family transcriptional activator/Flp pilus assembly protein TadD
MADPELAIHLLGGFQLLSRGEPVPVRSARVVLLLARLVLSRRAPLSRTQLASLFWPESSDAQARTNLRKVLLELRRALPGADRVLATEGPSLVWRPDHSCHVDVEEFEQAASRASSAADLEAAVGLYRGDLLPGFYEDWVLAERERLRQLYLSLLDRLVDALEAEGNYERAVLYARKLLDADPVREDVYRHLMRLHVLMGDRAEAVRTYHRCAASLRQELDVDPSPATREAYTRLLHADTRLPEEISPPPARAPHNLPTILPSFVGRDAEVAEVTDLVGRSRLVTLTGPAGCGKTRLALRVAEGLLEVYPEGVWLVDCVPLGEPALLPHTVAAVLGVREEHGRRLEETLASALASRALLIVLDNCEHVAEACAGLVAFLLTRCPRIRVLATSRQPLLVPGEIVWRVPPLAAPPTCDRVTPEEAERYEAVRLFVERATAVQPAFRLTSRTAPLACEICRRLDGLPLAIELAAARVRVLTLHQIATRLHGLVRLLETRGPAVSPRHRSLEAALDWSYALLSEPEQRLLRRLGVFAGGWTLEAAEAVCAGEDLPAPEVLDRLAELVDKSFVLVDTQEGEARYRLLEVVRQYCCAKLDAAGETAAYRARHLRYYLQLVEEVQPRLWGSDQVTWLAWVEGHHDNIRAALAHALDHDPATGLRLAAGLWRFWKLRNHGSEGRRWLAHLLQAAPAPSVDRARALHGLGYLTSDSGDHGTARAQVEEAVALFQALGDLPGKARALTTLGIIAGRQGDYASARRYHEESLSLYGELSQSLGAAYALNNLGLVRANEGDEAGAQAAFEESLAIFRREGDLRGVGIALTNLGSVLHRRGELQAARAALEESLAVKSELGETRGLVVLLEEFASLAVAEGAPVRAARLYGAAAAHAERLGAHFPLSDFRAHHEGRVERIRAALGGEAFGEAWAAGRDLTLSQALDLARGRTPLR